MDQQARYTLTHSSYDALLKLMEGVAADHEKVKRFTDIQKESEALANSMMQAHHSLSLCREFIGSRSVQLSRRRRPFDLETGDEDDRPAPATLLGVASSIISDVATFTTGIRNAAGGAIPQQPYRADPNERGAQHLHASILINERLANRFVSSIIMAEEGLVHLPELLASILSRLEGYYRALEHRHRNQGIRVYNNPLVTDVALSIYENVDSNGEIEDGRDPKEVSAYSIRKAKALLQVFRDEKVSELLYEAPGGNSGFIQMVLGGVMVASHLARDLQLQTSRLADHLQTILGPGIKKTSWEVGVAAEQVNSRRESIKDLDPIGIGYEEPKVLLTQEERAEIAARNKTIGLVVELLDSNSSDHEIVQAILKRKSELHLYYREKNSFYVCRIGSGNVFSGVAPGALEIIPGTRPMASLDEVVGEGIDQVKGFLQQVEASKEWHDLFLATSPSRTTDKSNVLLIGPQGCGKTEVLRAVGAADGSIGVFAQGSDFLTCWRGEAEKNPKRLFQGAVKLQKEAKRHVHLLIDEIDSVLAPRGPLDSSNNLSLEFQILMDGIVNYPSLSVWGTTNSPQRIPMPMIRRFSMVVIIGELNQERRIRLLRQFIEGFMPVSEFSDEAWDEMATLLKGATGDIIRKVADEVWRRSMHRFVSSKPTAARRVTKWLQKSGQQAFDLSAFSGKQRSAFRKKLGEHVSVLPADVHEVIEERLANVAIQQEIATAVETYENARKFIMGLKRAA